MRIAMFRGYGRKNYGDFLTGGLSVLDAAVPKLSLTSALGPPIVIDHPFAPPPEGAPAGTQTGATSPSGGNFLPLLQPKFTVYTPADAITIAPWGDPGEETLWPFIKLGLVALGVLAVYGGYKLARG
jgi:hypothetical protein